jgi:Phage tail lysozyme
MNGRELMGALQQRGYSPVQAAALAGHMLQESGGDPTNVNPQEDAHGLLQWRLDRWDNLRKFASDRGTDPTDVNTQLDFIRQEMNGPEAKSSQSFLRAGDVDTASSALKPYIRFGDNSAQARLDNARGILGQGPSPITTPPQQQTDTAAPAATGASTSSPQTSLGSLDGGVSATPAAPAAPATGQGMDQATQGWLAALKQQQGGQQQQQDEPLMQLAPAPAPGLAAGSQLAAAMQRLSQKVT